ncbi:DGQHR domain-containing protein [Bradyrhizobium sp. USDA 4508]
MAVRLLRRPGGYAARLITQGTHRFFTLTLPSDLLAETCVVDTREGNPVDGFQRMLDARRAQDIADYIDSGFGTIPCSIVLSAQPKAQLQYHSENQTVSFRRVPGAFLILDGQHRVFGFHLAKAKLRVPVVIYNNLKKSEEARLFIDINTKQRPVPNELLLDIKRLAETETEVESLSRDVFDLFSDNEDSPLRGLMSPSSRSRGKLSRVTFNTALKPIFSTFGDSDADFVYETLRNYIAIWTSYLRTVDEELEVTSPTLFRAIMLLFPSVAERVATRFGNSYSKANFEAVMAPFFSRVRRTDLKNPGNSPVALNEKFKQALESGFAIRRG